MAAPASRTDSYGMQLPASFYSDTEKTFQFDDSLPSLPVPPLDQTLRKYLESVRPHVTDAEYAHTERVVQQFGAGVGQTLHQMLCEKASTERNWLSKWWEDGAYLSYRDAHPPYLNFAGPGPYMNTYWPPQDGTQIERASLITYFTLRYWQMIRKQEMKVDRLGRKNMACMYQFHRSFNSCKTPGLEVDQLNDYFKTEEEGECPSHVVVICKGRYFTMDSLAADGDILTAPELQKQLQYIRDKCDAEPWGPGVGSLTGARRPDWYKSRKHLMDVHPDNKGFIQIIQTCITIIVLEDSSPTTDNAVVQEGFLGDSINRWLDKTLEFIAFKNGTTACNGDHCPLDAMGMVSYHLFILACFPCNWCDREMTWQGTKTIRPMATPTELTFHLDATLVDAIRDARALYRKNCDSVEVATGVYRGYGKDFIRKYKLHPDAYVQMALQYNYYKMYQKPAPTYETASTRKFYHGRTETVRSCTMESLAWAKTVTDSSTSKEQQLKALMVAMDKHISLMSEAMDNQGCDRHLLGLQFLASENGLGVPEIYTDPSYTKSGGGGNYVLSTSFVGYTPVYGGTVAMCKNGYGNYYSMTEKIIQMFCVCWTEDDTSAERWFNSLCSCLDDMKGILEGTCGGRPAGEVAAQL